MAPFGRFSSQARRTLSLAQQEAEARQQSYIGTEHLLLGLIVNTEGIAHRVLTTLGADMESARRAIDDVRSGDEGMAAAEVVPTSRVKAAIEIAFDEGRRDGAHYVGTEHLLLGLLIEGRGIAGHALDAMRVTLPQARAEIERERARGGGETIATPEAPVPETVPQSTREVIPALGPDAAELLRLAEVLATAEGVPVVGLEHVGRALDDQAVGSLLQLSARIRQAVAAREEAIAARDPRAAAERRQEERRLREEHARAEAEWRRGLR
ncbi:MAG: hypothetical protein J2P58_15080 [Acidimicrobiaceae bacterium]|nr:hypothetical protein [Acidimicrobiaceae bacterium]